MEVGTRIAINVGGRYGTAATHEVVGHEGHYLLICPVAKVADIVPGQNWVPVTRITEDRVMVRNGPPVGQAPPSERIVVDDVTRELLS